MSFTFIFLNQLIFEVQEKGREPICSFWRADDFPYQTFRVCFIFSISFDFWNYILLAGADPGNFLGGGGRGILHML